MYTVFVNKSIRMQIVSSVYRILLKDLLGGELLALSVGQEDLLAALQ